MGARARDHKRNRRQLDVFGKLAVGGLVSYGVMTVEHFFEESRNAENIERLNAALTHDISLMKTPTDKNIAATKLIRQGLNRSWSQVDLFSKELNNFANSARLLIAATGSDSDARNELKMLFDLGKANRVSPSYKRLFPNSHLDWETKIAHWIYRECQFIEPDTLIMGFDIPKLSKNVKILKADPFHFVRTNEEGSDCLNQFDGSRYAFWDSQNNCERHHLAARQRKKHRFGAGGPRKVPPSFEPN